MPVRRLLVCALLTIAIPGCAYTTQSTLDPQYQTVYVAPFANESQEYDLQAPLTNAVVRKFLNDGRLEVVTQPGADLVVEGIILDYAHRGLAFDQQDEVTQFLTVIRARVKVSDARSGRVVWEDPAVYGETTFSTRIVGSTSDRLRGNAQAFLPSVRSFSTDEENQAASEALEQLATEIFYRTVEPW